VKNKSISKPTESPLKILKRILSYATKEYKLRLIIVVISILISAGMNAIVHHWRPASSLRKIFGLLTSRHSA